MPPAGWYPDPANEANIRYWDGQAWSDRSQPKSVPPPPAAPSYPAPAAPQPVQQHPSEGSPFGYPAGPQGPQLLDPYSGYAPAPPVVPLPGRLGPDGQILSGWWRRVGGYLIDSLLVLIPTVLAGAIAGAIIVASGGSIFNQQAFDELSSRMDAGDTNFTVSDSLSIFASGFWTVLIVAALFWFIASMINGVYLVSRSGQTIGDRAVNTRKVMAGRTVPALGTALARWLIPNVLFALVSNLVPLGFLLTWLDYLWPLWDPRSQALHDKMVKTYVERSDLTGPPVPRS